jgi:hypothetical protein
LTPELPGGLDFKLLHVGVAVPSLGPAVEALTDLFGYKVVSGPYDDPLQKVTVLFLAKTARDVAEIELIAPLGADSPIQSMLAKSGGGAYHLCFETNELDGALDHAKKKRLYCGFCPCSCRGLRGTQNCMDLHSLAAVVRAGGGQGYGMSRL